MGMIERKKRLLMMQRTDSTNYLDGVSWTTRAYINDNGEIRTSAYYQNSDIVTLQPGTYVFTGVCSRNAENIITRIHRYSQNGDWVEMLAKETKQYMEAYNLQFVASQSPTYIRVSTSNPIDSPVLRKV